MPKPLPRYDPSVRVVRRRWRPPPLSAGAVGAVCCGITALFAYVQQLRCLGDSSSLAVARWCAAGPTHSRNTMILSFVALSLAGALLMALLHGFRSRAGVRLATAPLVAIWAGLLGELVLIVLAPAVR